jgi:hypothetical protein
MRRGESEVASAPNTHRGTGRKAARHGPVQRTLGVANACRRRAGQAKTWRCPPDQQTSHVTKSPHLLTSVISLSHARNETRPGTCVDQAALPGVQSGRDALGGDLPLCLVREDTPDAGNIPRKQNDRKRACGRLRISLACPEGSVSCSQLIQSGRIVPQVPSGATMPHAALGAVGEHGCRRRA